MVYLYCVFPDLFLNVISWQSWPSSAAAGCSLSRNVPSSWVLVDLLLLCRSEYIHTFPLGGSTAHSVKLLCKNVTGLWRACLVKLWFYTIPREWISGKIVCRNYGNKWEWPTSDYCDFNMLYSIVYTFGFGPLGPCRLSKVNSKTPQKEDDWL